MDQKKYNIFISYGWADNEPSGAGREGWVGTFVDRLRNHLNRKLPHQYQGDGVWLDYERLRGSDPLKASIREKVRASRILIPIVSPSYLDSAWCRQEREAFLQLHGPNSGRIFPVWMSPADNLPPALDDLLKYKFWYEDERNQPRTRWFPDIDATDREYGRLQEDLARDLAERLVEIRSAEPSAGTVAPKPIATSHRPSGKHLVLVNGGDDDAALVREVADRLYQNHGLGTMVPLSALPDTNGITSSAIRRDLRDKLKLCSAVLMVYKNGPVHQIHSQITEFLRSVPQRPKHHPVPTLDLCHPADGSLSIGMNLPQVRDFPCGPDWTADCCRQLASLLP